MSHYTISHLFDSNHNKIKEQVLVWTRTQKLDPRVTILETILMIYPKSLTD